MSEHTPIPNTKRGTTVVFGIAVFLIRRKYTMGAVNNRSKIIPIDRASALATKKEDWASNTIMAIINAGVPKMIRLL